MRNDIDYIALGKRIDALLKARNKNQLQLSIETGISKSHLSHIICGTTRVSQENLQKIAESLDTTLDDLLYDSLTVLNTSYDKDLKDIIDNYDSSVKDIMYSNIKHIIDSMNMR